MDRAGTNVVAIDGPAGSGKSTVAKAVARELGYVPVDTGAMYRCVALEARSRGVPPEDGAALADLVAGLDVRFEFGEQGQVRVFLGDREVTGEIREPEVSEAASTYAAVPEVRAGLLELQRRFGRARPGAVLEGRDIGTVVFPDARFKFFVTATPEERARRRYLELQARGEQVSYEEVLAATRARDHADSTRAVAPLRAAEDAEVIDTTGLSVDQVVARIVERVRVTGA